LIRIPTLERYVARQVYSAVGFVLLGFLALFGFFDLIAELRDLDKGSYQLRQIFMVVVLWVPAHAYELFPVAVLIGTLYVLAHLSSNSEYTVMRAAGLSPGRASAVLVKVGLVFVAATFAIGEWIAPYSEEAAQKLRMEAQQSMIGSSLNSGLWLKDERSFINVREAREASVLGGVRIYEFDSAYRLRQVTEAERAEYAGKGGWRLQGVMQTMFGPSGPTTARYAEAAWRSTVSPDLLNVLIVDPQRMSAWKLYKYLQHLAGNRQKTERYEIALWKKLFYPLATLVMMALALPFAYVQVRLGGLGVRIFSGIMLGVLFHLLNGLSSSLGIIQNWAPFYSAVLPSVLFLFAAMVMMWWVERR
jgi:lipopolysaccharide export system permease protein